jgi:hypothetical protein
MYKALRDGQRDFLQYCLDKQMRNLDDNEVAQLENCIEEGRYRANGARPKTFNSLRTQYLREYEQHIIYNQ